MRLEWSQAHHVLLLRNCVQLNQSVCDIFCQSALPYPPELPTDVETCNLLLVENLHIYCSTTKLPFYPFKLELSSFPVIFLTVYLEGSATMHICICFKTAVLFVPFCCILYCFCYYFATSASKETYTKNNIWSGIGNTLMRSILLHLTSRKCYISHLASAISRIS
jgi:hypothetical protein